ncbi:hypothetical protein MIMGU_mgv11b000466mg [Erythranthe guttata]|uniref:Uncharacterized protein n=1 Tax=Erythranthe guttata TaxID=4155 RepID=A0A022Q811_ERYGU|nr:hypothetical protein MIMGU_mgv11b000466mg [Erythranthe guttata]
MPKSSRHKSHKQSKHSSRDYSDSEEDVIKMKEKSSKDENSIRVHRDSASGDKRKVSSSVREGKDSKDLSGHGNGDVLEEYVSSKRRKEKTDVVIVGDRWSGGVEERGDSDRNVEKESHKGDILKVDLKLKETSSKGESLRVESRSKSKRHDSGIVGERKDDSLASVVLEKEEGKSKGESKRRSERDSSSRKDGKDTKEKDRRSDKEKNGGQESKIADAEVMKLVDMDLVKKQVPQLVDFSEDKQGKRARDNTGTSRESLNWRRISRKRRARKEKLLVKKRNITMILKKVMRGDCPRKKMTTKMSGEEMIDTVKMWIVKVDAKMKSTVKTEENEIVGGRKTSTVKQLKEKAEEMTSTMKMGRGIAANVGMKGTMRMETKMIDVGTVVTETMVTETTGTRRKSTEKMLKEIFGITIVQDESKYRDHNYEERNRHSMTSSRDYAGAVGGSEKPSSRSGEKLGQKDDGLFGELSAERRLKSDMRSSPLKLVDNHKSPSSSDRRPFGRPDVRRSTDVDESMQRSGGGSRDWKDYPGEELSQADADNTSSPFVRNNHYSNISKALPPPPPYRTGLDSPSVLGSGEDDGRGKPNMRHRRMGDPNMGRMQGNAWRGVPSWPSPVANGFLPYPHGPHPVGFHTVMQPFPSPQMFVRPSMDLSHASPYHMPDADRFSGPGRPMGWRNQVDDSCPPLSGWETSNAVFGDDSHIYGRPEWEHSRNLSVSRGWESSADLWKGQNRTSSMEALSSEKENNSIRSGEGALSVQPVQPAENEQSRGVNQQTDSTDVDQSTKSFGKNDVEASLVSAEGGDDGVAKMSRMDDLPICHVYLSKLDISTDLTEPELFDKCRGLMDVEHSMFSDIDDSKILYMEDVEARMASSHRLLSYALFASTDDSVFQKSMSLYKRQKGQFSAEGGEETEVLGEMVPDSAQEEDDIMEEDQTEKLCPTDAMQGIEENNTLPDFDIEMKPTNDLQNTEAYAEPSEQMIDPPLDSITVKTEEPDSDKDNEEKAEGSETTNNEETKLVDSKFGPLLSSDDVSSEASEAMMPESMVAGSVNLSRIHHSPESTH